MGAAIHHVVSCSCGFKGTDVSNFVGGVMLLLKMYLLHISVCVCVKMYIYIYIYICICIDIYAVLRSYVLELLHNVVTIQLNSEG